jgi:hypothetical protein
VTQFDSWLVHAKFRCRAQHLRVSDSRLTVQSHCRDRDSAGAKYVGPLRYTDTRTAIEHHQLHLVSPARGKRFACPSLVRGEHD